MRWALRVVLCLVPASASADSSEIASGGEDQVAEPLYLELGIAADARYAIVRDAMALAPRELAVVRGTFRWIGEHNYYVATPIVGLDASAGWAANAPFAYDVHINAGLRAHMWLWNGRGHYVGFLVGFGRDAVGRPPAWTVPIDAFYQWHVGQTRIMGVHGGPRFALADRAHGWNAGVDLKLLGVGVDSPSAFAPRDLAISLDVNGLADNVYLGVSVGVGSRQSSRYWER